MEVNMRCYTLDLKFLQRLAPHPVALHGSDGDFKRWNIAGGS
jgi:hypothetical protein